MRPFRFVLLFSSLCRGLFQDWMEYHSVLNCISSPKWSTRRPLEESPKLCCHWLLCCGSKRLFFQLWQDWLYHVVPCWPCSSRCNAYVCVRLCAAGWIVSMPRWLSDIWRVRVRQIRLLDHCRACTKDPSTFRFAWVWRGVRGGLVWCHRIILWKIPLELRPPLLPCLLGDLLLQCKAPGEWEVLWVSHFEWIWECNLIFPVVLELYFGRVHLFET